MAKNRINRFEGELINEETSSKVEPLVRFGMATSMARLSDPWPATYRSGVMAMERIFRGGWV